MTTKEIRVLHFSVICPVTLTIPQAMEYTNLGKKKIRKLIALGILEITRPDHEEGKKLVKGKAPLIFRESIENYLTRNKLKVPKSEAA